MTPKFQFLKWRIGHPKRDALRREMIAWFEAEGRADDPEYAELADFLRHNPPDFLPYDFARDIHARAIQIHEDPKVGLPFIDHNGKRLYWREGRKLKRIPKDYNAICAEQHPASPHRYLSDRFDITDGDVLVDVGSAEGSLSLDVIDRVGHVYLFETDASWTRALEATFAPWAEKVTIVPKFVGNETRGDMIRLDDYFGTDQRIDFLKLDVEGYEAEVLDGARGLIDAGCVTRTAVCAYHRREDEANLTRLLIELGFEVEVTPRYMLLYREDGFAPPYVRRGLLRATRAA
ncbi:MAG: FkbM family methyltransferase [Pseudomonadota bacterium]